MAPYLDWEWCPVTETWKRKDPVGSVKGLYLLSRHTTGTQADYCQASNYRPLKGNIFFNLSAPILSIPWSTVRPQEWDNQGKYGISPLNATCFLFIFINMPTGFLPCCNSTRNPKTNKEIESKSCSLLQHSGDFSSSFQVCHIFFSFIFFSLKFPLQSSLSGGPEKGRTPSSLRYVDSTFWLVH